MIQLILPNTVTYFQFYWFNMQIFRIRIWFVNFLIFFQVSLIEKLTEFWIFLFQVVSIKFNQLFADIKSKFLSCLFYNKPFLRIGMNVKGRHCNYTFWKFYILKFLLKTTNFKAQSKCFYHDVRLSMFLFVFQFISSKIG